MVRKTKGIPAFPRGVRPASRRWRLRSWDWASVAVLVLALVVRVVVLYQLGDHPLLQPKPEGLLDDSAYVRLATSVASGDLALRPDAYYLPPLYTYFLGTVFFLFNGSIFAARVTQLLLGTMAVALTMLTARRWFGNTASLAAGILAACTGLLAFNETLILQSSIDPFLASLAFFTLARAVHIKRETGFLLAGATLAALVLNRPNALVCIPAVAAAWLGLQRSRQSVRHVVALTLGAVLVIAPVAIRNRFVSGEWVLVTSHGGLNFYVGNGDGATGTWRSIPGIAPTIVGQVSDVRRAASDALGRAASAGEASAFFYSRAWREIAERPGAWLAVLLRKAALTFSANDAALNYSFAYYSRDESNCLPALVVGPWLVIPLGMMGLTLGGPRNASREYAAWMAAVAAYATSLIAFFVSSRYRLVLLIPMLVGSGAAVAWFAENRRAAKRVVVALAGLSVVFLAVNWPMNVDDGRYYERTERMVQYIVDGRLDEARHLFQIMEQTRPSSPALLFRVGAELQRRGAWDEAIPYLERAAGGGSVEPEWHYALGQSLIHAGRVADAVPHLEAAYRAGLRSAVLIYDLAWAENALGHLDRARAALGSIDLDAPIPPAQLIQIARLGLLLEQPHVAELALRHCGGQAEHASVVHDLLSVALAMEGERRAALLEAEEAVRMDAKAPAARFHLAVAYARLGHLVEARAEALECLELDPEYDDARRLLGQLPQDPND